ncbi:uncharacterized protein N7515_008597 [Penicillium bovifimosum]|uniref:Uncharacterized protein n=1 Tax=Penicillium bovifimosum TaxID=126998 RepID=A0A9W9GPK6_9EURO|nr:uncharacterized protein N7515_008597 [Penicillium bovifimosum]KAJ5124772.1 hypothetical protein N7515_008597 [Penicillium bovifimosum]
MKLLKGSKSCNSHDSDSFQGSHLLPNGLELDVKEAPWYTSWLKAQSTKIPSQTFNIFHANHEHCTFQSHWDLFTRTFLCVAELAIQDSTITIDGIIGNLLGEDILDSETLEENLNYARYFVFCLLAYQTMLYSPVLDLTFKTPQLCITEDLGCCNYTHASLTQDVANCAHEPISELLMGFGVLLPSRNLCLDDDQSIHHAFQQQTEVGAKTFNAYALHYIAGIKVKWTDALSCHLEFNSATKEMSLFRFPSFCQFSLANYDQGKGRGVLHACATTSRLRCQWATETDINQFLLEVLLSYRLLFGQTKKSRSLFRSMEPFLRTEQNTRDSLLFSLCGMRSLNMFLLDLLRDWNMVEKEKYYLPNDFPILRYRIVVLQRYLSASGPRTWLQLWRDNRNSANWMTFWAVIIFGAFGSLMALLQVILQSVQLFV